MRLAPSQEKEATMRAALGLVLGLVVVGAGVARGQDEGWDDGWDDGWGGVVRPTAPPVAPAPPPIEPADQADYDAGLLIVNAKQRADYPRAIRLLQGVARRRGPLAGDAVAYLEWIEADFQCVAAQRLFDLTGQRERPLEILRAAAQHEVLGPEARKGLRERIARIEAAPPPTAPAAAPRSDEVRTVSGEVIGRELAIELRDPTDGRAFWISLLDRSLARNVVGSRGQPVEPFLRVLARGAPPQDPAPATGLPPGHALRGLAGALGGM